MDKNAIKMVIGRDMPSSEKPMECEAGVVLILMVFLLLVFCGIVALISDIGNQIISRTALQNAADAAALAGARSLDGTAQGMLNAVAIADDVLALHSAPGANTSPDLIPPPDTDPRPEVYHGEDLSGKNLKITIEIGAIWQQPISKFHGFYHFDPNRSWPFLRFTTLNNNATTGGLSNLNFVNATRVTLERPAISTFIAGVLGITTTSVTVSSVATMDVSETPCAAPFMIPLCHVQPILADPNRCYRDVFFIPPLPKYPEGYFPLEYPWAVAMGLDQPVIESIVGTMALTGPRWSCFPCGDPNYTWDSGVPEQTMTFYDKLACVHTFLGDKARPLPPPPDSGSVLPFSIRSLEQLINLINNSFPGDEAYRHVSFSTVFGGSPEYCVGANSDGSFVPQTEMWPQAYPIPPNPPPSDPPLICPPNGYNNSFCHMPTPPDGLSPVIPNSTVLKTNFMLVVPKDPNYTYCGASAVSMQDDRYTPMVAGFITGYIFDFDVTNMTMCGGVRARLSCDTSDAVPSPILTDTPTTYRVARPQPRLVHEYL